jgi:dipeptide/tripeptide permease
MAAVTAHRTSGSFTAGVLAEEAGVEWALATAGIACAVGFVVALAGRRSLRPAVVAET